MSKHFFFCILCVCLCNSFVLADIPVVSNAVSALSGASKENMKLLREMNRQHREGNELGAMVAATQILTTQPGLQQAVNFVHENYERTDKNTQIQLLNLTNTDYLPTAEKRCEIYRLLTIINNNLAQVPMPLTGPNEKWIWQPEIVYYQGHWDEARTKVFDLLMDNGQKSLTMHDTESAQTYFTRAINYYLTSDEERHSNTDFLIHDLVALAKNMERTNRTRDAIFAYELYNLAGNLDTLRSDMDSAKIQACMRVAACYTTQAGEQEKGSTLNDWETAYESYRNAQDWNNDNTTIAKMQELKLRIAEYHYQNGLSAEQAGQTEQAAESFKQALEWQPAYKDCETKLK